MRTERAEPLILVVDDDAKNSMVIEAMLKPLGCQIAVATNGTEALDIARLSPPDVILMDIAMPGIDGYEAVRQMRQCSALEHTPIVMVTALHGVDSRVESLKAGADDYLLKPVDVRELRARVETLVCKKVQLDSKHRELRNALKCIRDSASESVAQIIIKAIEAYDVETGLHVKRIRHYTEAIAKAVGLPAADAELMGIAAQLHDVGKIGVDDSVLRKRGKLSVHERELMCRHAAIGADLLSKSDLPLMRIAARITASHHEKWDGSGYPDGLSGETIPIEGRIVAVADCFDALTSDRCYRETGAYSANQAFEIMQSERGTHFDPRVLDAFLSIRVDICFIWQDLHA